MSDPKDSLDSAAKKAHKLIGLAASCEDIAEAIEAGGAKPGHQEVQRVLAKLRDGYLDEATTIINDHVHESPAPTAGIPAVRTGPTVREQR